MPMWAIILRIWADEPVYHRYWGNLKSGEDRTKCGRRIGAFVPWLPMKHVVKFARPCKGCFPE